MNQYANNHLPEIELKFKTGETIKTVIKSSKEAYELFMEFYDQDVFELTESLIVIYLNGGNKTIGWQKHSQGGIAGTVIDPRLIVATALKCAARGIIISHNHPSGKREPSEQDVNITKQLKEGCRYFDIILTDHIIATTDGYYSFADEGELLKNPKSQYQRMSY